MSFKLFEALRKSMKCDLLFTHLLVESVDEVLLKGHHFLELLYFFFHFASLSECFGPNGARFPSFVLPRSIACPKLPRPNRLLGNPNTNNALR